MILCFEGKNVVPLKANNFSRSSECEALMHRGLMGYDLSTNILQGASEKVLRRSSLIRSLV